MLFMLCVVAVIGTWRLSETDYYKKSELDMVLFIVDMTIGWATFCVLLVMILCSSGSMEVKLYQRENIKIERKIDLLAKNYIDHESDFYKDFKKKEMELF